MLFKLNLENKFTLLNLKSEIFLREFCKLFLKNISRDKEITTI